MPATLPARKSSYRDLPSSPPTPYLRLTLITETIFQVRAYLLGNHLHLFHPNTTLLQLRCLGIGNQLKFPPL
jgi:hypothetical protein